MFIQYTVLGFKPTTFPPITTRPGLTQFFSKVLDYV